MFINIITVMDYNKERTTIPCFNPTRDELREMGKKGETYDTIINRLMNFWKRMHNDKK